VLRPPLQQSEADLLRLPASEIGGPVADNPPNGTLADRLLKVGSPPNDKSSYPLLSNFISDGIIPIVKRHSKSALINTVFSNNQTKWKIYVKMRSVELWTKCATKSNFYVYFLQDLHYL